MWMYNFNLRRSMQNVLICVDMHTHIQTYTQDRFYVWARAGWRTLSDTNAAASTFQRRPRLTATVPRITVQRGLQVGPQTLPRMQMHVEYLFACASVCACARGLVPFLLIMAQVSDSCAHAGPPNKSAPMPMPIAVCTGFQGASTHAAPRPVSAVLNGNSLVTSALLRNGHANSSEEPSAHVAARMNSGMVHGVVNGALQMTTTSAVNEPTVASSHGISSSSNNSAVAAQDMTMPHEANLSASTSGSAAMMMMMGAMGAPMSHMHAATASTAMSGVGALRHDTMMLGKDRACVYVRHACMRDMRVCKTCVYARHACM
jgi:hypothetical protein